MAYKEVYDVNEVSYGLNYVVGGAITLRTEEDVTYLSVDGKYYKFSKDGFETGNHLSGQLFKYGTQPTNIYGRFLAFKINESKKPTLYITIVSKNKDSEHEPIMIYSESKLNNGKDTDSKIVNFCYRPKKDTSSRYYNGSIGWISEDTYYTVFNKSRLLKKAIPKCDYIKKAESLKRKIENCKILSMVYSKEHENLDIPDVFPQEANKLYFISKLRYMIENYSSTKIYYSQSLKRLEEKYKSILEYYKYNNIAS